MVSDMLRRVAGDYGRDHLRLKQVAKDKSGERLGGSVGQPDRETKPWAADEKRPASAAQRLRGRYQNALLKRKW